MWLKMFQKNQHVKICFSNERLEVFDLMGEVRPWFHNKLARLKELIYEEKDFDESVIERFWRVQIFDNCETNQILSERDLMGLEN